MRGVGKCSVLNQRPLFSAYRGHCSCGRMSSPGFENFTFTDIYESSPPQQVSDIFRCAVALWIRYLEQLDANNCRCDVGPRGCPHRRVHLDHLGVWQ